MKTGFAAHGICQTRCPIRLENSVGKNNMPVTCTAHRSWRSGCCQMCGYSSACHKATLLPSFTLCHESKIKSQYPPIYHGSLFLPNYKSKNKYPVKFTSTYQDGFTFLSFQPILICRADMKVPPMTYITGGFPGPLGCWPWHISFYLWQFM